MYDAVLLEDADLDEYGEWTDEKAARVAAGQHNPGGEEEEYGHVKLRKPIDMQTLCSSKGQILELDQNELDSAELARLATQMAMNDANEARQDPNEHFLRHELQSSVPSRDLFTQRLFDNTQDFDDQV